MIIDCITVILRAIELSDLSLLLGIINDPEIEKMVGGGSFPVSMDRQIKWFENYDQQSELRCIIQIKDGPAIGVIMLTNIDWRNRTGLTHIKVKAKPEDRRKNDTFDALMGFRNYCFNELNLNCIYSNILEYNLRSRTLAKKCGSVEEGVLRQRIFKDGKYHNLIVTSTLAEDFNPLFKKYLEDRKNEIT